MLRMQRCAVGDGPSLSRFFNREIRAFTSNELVVSSPVIVVSDQELIRWMRIFENVLCQNQDISSHLVINFSSGICGSRGTHGLITDEYNHLSDRPGRTRIPG